MLLPLASVWESNIFLPKRGEGSRSELIDGLKYREVACDSLIILWGMSRMVSTGFPDWHASELGSIQSTISHRKKQARQQFICPTNHGCSHSLMYVSSSSEQRRSHHNYASWRISSGTVFPLVLKARGRLMLAELIVVLWPSFTRNSHQRKVKFGWWEWLWHKKDTKNLSHLFH